MTQVILDVWREVYPHYNREVLSGIAVLTTDLPLAVHVASESLDQTLIKLGHHLCKKYVLL